MPSWSQDAPFPLSTQTFVHNYQHRKRQGKIYSPSSEAATNKQTDHWKKYYKIEFNGTIVMAINLLTDMQGKVNIITRK